MPTCNKRPRLRPARTDCIKGASTHTHTHTHTTKQILCVRLGGQAHGTRAVSDPHLRARGGGEPHGPRACDVHRAARDDARGDAAVEPAPPPFANALAQTPAKSANENDGHAPQFANSIAHECKPRAPMREQSANEIPMRNSRARSTQVGVTHAPRRQNVAQHREVQDLASGARGAVTRGVQTRARAHLVHRAALHGAELREHARRTRRVQCEIQYA